MDIQANKAAACGYFERLLNTGEYRAADTLFAPDVRFHYPLGELEGIVQIKNYITAVRTAFPDIEFAIEDLLGEKELVAVRWTLTGTQTGEFRGTPPTGKRVEVPGNTIFRMTDGRIREMWVAFNPASLL